jgi:hypothetical protein
MVTRITEAIEARVKPVSASVWLPMSIAPKDGSSILMKTRKQGIVIAAWLNRSIHGGPGEIWAHGYDGRDSHHEVEDPTGWMPLPSI